MTAPLSFSTSIGCTRVVGVAARVRAGTQSKPAMTTLCSNMGIPFLLTLPGDDPVSSAGWFAVNRRNAVGNANADDARDICTKGTADRPALAGRTSIVIAHRLSTILKADQILYQPQPDASCS